MEDVTRYVTIFQDRSHVHVTLDICWMWIIRTCIGKFNFKSVDECKLFSKAFKVLYSLSIGKESEQSYSQSICVILHLMKLKYSMAMYIMCWVCVGF